MEGLENLSGNFAGPLAFFLRETALASGLYLKCW